MWEMTGQTAIEVRQPTELGPAARPRSPVAIEEELGRCRATVERTTEQRLRDVAAREVARRQLAECTAQLRALDDRIQQANRTLFVLTPELERLAAIHDRVIRRGAELAVALSENLPPVASSPIALPPVEMPMVAATAGEATPVEVPTADAPVALAPQPVASGAERRVYPRVPLQVEVSFSSDANFYVGFSNDISRGGLFVVSYQELRPLGDRFAVVFSLPGTTRPITALVEVAWVREFKAGEEMRDGAPGMGLHFIGLADADRQAIEAFVQRRQPLFFPEPGELDA